MLVTTAGDRKLKAVLGSDGEPSDTWSCSTMYIYVGVRMGMRHHDWFNGGHEDPPSNDPTKGMRIRTLGGSLAVGGGGLNTHD